MPHSHDHHSRRIKPPASFVCGGSFRQHDGDLTMETIPAHLNLTVAGGALTVLGDVETGASITQTGRGFVDVQGRLPDGGVIKAEGPIHVVEAGERVELESNQSIAVDCFSGKGRGNAKLRCATGDITVTNEPVAAQEGTFAERVRNRIPGLGSGL